MIKNIVKAMWMYEHGSEKWHTANPGQVMPHDVFARIATQPTTAVLGISDKAVAESLSVITSLHDATLRVRFNPDVPPMDKTVGFDRDSETKGGRDKGGG